MRVRIPNNYFEYMQKRLVFNGIHNTRKLLVLLTIMAFKERGNHLGAAELYRMCAGPRYVNSTSYSGFRSLLSHLLKLRYISRTKKGYSLLGKGGRFLYATKELRPDVYDRIMNLVVKSLNSYHRADNDNVHQPR